MEFRILGSLEAESGGMLVPLGWPCERRVLAALLLDAGRVVPVPRLVDAVWDDDPPDTAGKQVRNAVSRLRRALGGAGGADLIVTVPGGYRLAAGGCTVDARVFEAGVAAAGRAASEGKGAEAAGLLRSALALWRGPALAGLAGRGLEPAAATWDERRAAALEMCLGLELALGRHQEVAGELAGLAAGNPLREKLAGLYMLALYRCGRRADALAAYHRTRELLAGQLGLDPGPELQRLQQQILTADPALALADTAPVAAGQPGNRPLAAAGPLPAVPQVRFGLPADTAAFTGRGAELSRITAAVKDAAGGGGVGAVGAIAGMAGVGKTALAVHVAHMLAGEFPDRQLFIDLHAHTPGHEPVNTVDALAGLLAAVGVDPGHLPGDLEGRAAIWRDRMAGQRALLVLDNAAGSGQVAPLLPGAVGCLVLVTSRRYLGDLPGVVVPVLLDVLPPGEAREMFARLAPRAAASPGEVAEIAELAGFLPLAISLLARLFARHLSWTLADLAAETRAGLLTLTAENDNIAAAFDLSYRHLDPARQRLFCLLGLHPGATTDAYAAAALAGTSVEQATGLLDGLHAEGLLIEAGHRRYGIHDLLRRYARDHALADLGSGQSEQALGRLLDYYQHAAALAEARLARQSRPGPPPAAPAAEPLAVPALGDAGQALAWARADRDSLLACLDHATGTGQHARVIALTAGLAGLLRYDGPWPDAITRHTAAIGAARQLGDHLGEANALTDLGGVRRLTDDYPNAAQALDQALSLYRDLGDQSGQASALTGLGMVRQQTGDLPGAAAALGQALSLYRDLGDQLGQATSLANLGSVRRQTGDNPGAAAALNQALNLYRDLGDQLGQAVALGHLGSMRQRTGDYPGAAQALEQALSRCRDLGYRLGQAATLTHLGNVRRETGDYPGAAQALDQALNISRDIGDQSGQASALTGLGSVRRETGDYPGAAQALDQALNISRDIGDQGGEAEVLNETGTLHRVSGDLTLAGQCHQQALDLARAIASPWDEAHALAGLGRCALAAGHATQAQALLRQAHQIFQQAGDADVGTVHAGPSALTSPAPTG